MSTDDESNIQYFLSRLASPNAKDRATALRSMAAAPIADVRVLEAAEQLLSDDAVTLLCIP